MCVRLLIFLLLISMTELHGRGGWFIYPLQTRVIDIKIEYNWKLLVTETYIETYSSLWNNIASLILSHEEFHITSIFDSTPNTTRQNIVYKFEDAVDLWNRNDTLTWNASITITCRQCSSHCVPHEGEGKQGCHQLMEYVGCTLRYKHNGLRDDIINKYDGYWGVLNIIDIPCDTGVNHFHFMNHWMIIILSVFSQFLL